MSYNIKHPFSITQKTVGIAKLYLFNNSAVKEYLVKLDEILRYMRLLCIVMLSYIYLPA